ncbi:MAG: ParB/RepB/Spo0J family partition protein [Acidobacteriota bacterium]
MKRQALGKGLDALLPASSGRSSPIVNVPISQVAPNPYQPRMQFPDEELETLAASIRERGLLQPIIVRPTAEGYEIIAGERRWRAAQRAGLMEIPALIKDVSEQDLLELALVENVQRADLSPIEEAQAYRLLADEFGLTQEEIAKRVGRSRSAVANLMRLLQLPAEVQAMVLAGELSMGHARALVTAPRRAQVSLARQAVQEGWSVRQMEDRVRSGAKEGRKEPRPPRPTDPNLRAAEERLEKHFLTKVEIRPNMNRGGTIVIHYYSEEELDRLYETLISTPRRDSRAFD